MYCKNCGSIINQGESFCGKCGAKVENSVSQMENPVSQIQQSNNNYNQGYVPNSNYN